MHNLILYRRFPTFKPVDPNGKCKANGINKEKRQSWEISQYDIWALNAAYGGPLPPCQSPKKVSWKQERGLNCRWGTGVATEETTTSVADTTAETVVCLGQM